MRKHVAEEILATAGRDLEVNARKLREACRPELVDAAVHGTLAWKLQAILECAAANLSGDIQNLEGINNIIKCIGNRCNFINLDLLSSRVQIKHQYLAQRRHDVRDKTHASLRPIAEDLHKKLSKSFGPATQCILSAPERWSTPQAADPSTLPSNDDLKRSRSYITPEAAITPDLVWASQYSAHFFSKHKVQASHVVLFGRLRDGVEKGYLHVDSDKPVSWMAACTVRKEVGPLLLPYKLKIDFPINTIKFSELAAQHRARILEHGPLSIMHHELDWNPWLSTGEAVIRDGLELFKLGGVIIKKKKPGGGGEGGGGGRGPGRAGRGRGRGRGRGPGGRRGGRVAAGCVADGPVCDLGPGLPAAGPAARDGEDDEECDLEADLEALLAGDPDLDIDLSEAHLERLAAAECGAAPFDDASGDDGDGHSGDFIAEAVKDKDPKSKHKHKKMKPGEIPDELLVGHEEERLLRAVAEEPDRLSEARVNAELIRMAESVAYVGWGLDEMLAEARLNCLRRPAGVDELDPEAEALTSANLTKASQASQVCLLGAYKFYRFLVSLVWPP